MRVMQREPEVVLALTERPSMANAVGVEASRRLQCAS